MVDTRIILSGLWTALMLIYLLGDVLRIFARPSHIDRLPNPSVFEVREEWKRGVRRALFAHEYQRDAGIE